MKLLQAIRSHRRKSSVVSERHTAGALISARDSTGSSGPVVQVDEMVTGRVDASRRSRAGS